MGYMHTALGTCWVCNFYLKLKCQIEALQPFLSGWFAEKLIKTSFECRTMLIMGKNAHDQRFFMHISKDE